MPYFRHERVIGDGNGIFGDKTDLSQKIFSLVVYGRRQWNKPDIRKDSEGNEHLAGMVEADILLLP
jgi:hypothetical protein